MFLGGEKTLPDSKQINLAPTTISLNHVLISRRQSGTQIIPTPPEKGPLLVNEVLRFIQLGTKLGSLGNLFTREQTGNCSMEWREIKDAAGCVESEGCVKHKTSILTSANY